MRFGTNGSQTAAQRARWHLATLRVVVLVSVLTHAPELQAQSYSSYSELIEDALHEWESGHWDESRGLFRAAHAIRPNARTLRGIGMASFELRDYAESYRALKASLDERRRPLDATQREQVTALLERVRARVGFVTVRTNSPDTVIEVDGVPVADTARTPIVLGLGRHDIVVRLGERSSSTSVTTLGGDEQTIEIDLREAQAVDANAGEPVALPLATSGIAHEPATTSEVTREPMTSLPTPNETASASQPVAALDVVPRVVAVPPDDRRRSSSTIVIAASAALTGGAIVPLSMGLHDRRRIVDAEDGTEWASLERAEQRHKVLVGAGISTAIVGLVGLVVGVNSRVHSRRRVHASTSASASGFEVRF